MEGETKDEGMRKRLGDKGFRADGMKKTVAFLFFVLFVFITIAFSLSFATSSHAIIITGTETITTNSSASYSAADCGGAVSWSVAGTGASISSNGILTTGAASCGGITVTAKCSDGSTASKTARVTDAGRWIYYSHGNFNMGCIDSCYYNAAVYQSGISGNTKYAEYWIVHCTPVGISCNDTGAHAMFSPPPSSYDCSYWTGTTFSGTCGYYTVIEKWQCPSCTNGQTISCYSGASETKGVGICKAGTQTCTNGQWGVCQGEVLPAAEVCSDNKDNNCDGQVDEGCPTCTDMDGDGHYAISANCPQGNDCNDNDSSIYPGATEKCDDKDNNCNGQTDEGFSVGIACSVGVGACERNGVTVCSADHSGTICSATPGSPSPETCDGIDNDCNNTIDDISPQTCYSGPFWTAGVGICKSGTQTCTNGQWGTCEGEILPATEECNGKDNNCDGQKDETCLGGSCSNIPTDSSANPASGNLYHDQTLFQTTNSKLQTGFTLSYNSLDNYTGILGKGWTHNYNLSLFSSPDGSIGLKKGDGRIVYFRYSQGIYYPEASSGEDSYILYNADGTYTLTEKDGTTYNFNSAGKLISIRDRNGNTVILTYTDNNLTGITDPSGRTTYLTYDSSNKITSITDQSNNIYTFTYSNNMLVSVSFPLVGSASGESAGAENPSYWLYSYDSNGQMQTKTDAAGYTTTYSYDSEGRVTSSTDPEGKIKTISYNQANNTATVTEKDGGIWTYRYDPLLNVTIEKTDPLGNATTYEYDNYKNLLSTTEPDGSVTSYTYDGYGNMASVTDPAGNTTAYTYNEFGQITSVIDSEGNTTRYTYDANGNLISTIDPTGATTQYQYDSRGNVLSITNSNGQTTSFTYDQFNNLTSITDSTGAVTTFVYDSAGNMVSQTDPQGNTTRFVYDSLNRLIQLITPNSELTTFTYDANGNRTSQTDGNGNITYYEYNYKGQLIKVTDSLGNVTTYSYGGSGCPSCGGGGDKLTAITDAKGQITMYLYDSLGRLIKETDSLGNSITYSYDSKGNLTTKTNADSNAITYNYDTLGRLTKKTYPDGSVEVFEYNSKSEITYAGNKDIAYQLSYDSNGRLTTSTDSNGLTVRYEYDSLGNRIKMIMPDGRIISYRYDANNRLIEIYSEGQIFTFIYDNLGRRTKMTLPNGTYATYSYDTNSRLTNLMHKTSSGAIINSFAYTHDYVGNRLTKTMDTGTKYAYSYDSIYRLTEALSSAPGFSSNTKGKGSGISNAIQQQKEFYTYDPVGNRLTSDHNRTYTYNAGNQLVTENGIAYTYDKNGNLISKIDGLTSFTYFYDYENRLTKVIKTENGTTTDVEFKYNPFGRRIEKSVTDTVTGTITIKRYFYDNEDILFEYDDNGVISNRYIHGLGIDEPLALTTSQGTYYYHADGLGSIVALTDSSGKIVQTYEYDSFGNLKDQKNRIKQPYTFTSREWDKEIGLYSYRPRNYDPTIGRFTTRDPRGLTGGINLYLYAKVNPVLFIDPSGQIAELCTRPLQALPFTRMAVHCYVKVGEEVWNFNDKGVGIEPKPTGKCRPINQDKCEDKDEAILKRIKESENDSQWASGTWCLTTHNCCHWAIKMLNGQNPWYPDYKLPGPDLGPNSCR